MHWQLGTVCIHTDSAEIDRYLLLLGPQQQTCSSGFAGVDPWWKNGRTPFRFKPCFSYYTSSTNSPLFIGSNAKHFDRARSTRDWERVRDVLYRRGGPGPRIAPRNFLVKMLMRLGKKMCSSTFTKNANTSPITSPLSYVQDKCYDLSRRGVFKGGLTGSNPRPRNVEKKIVCSV